MNSAEPSGSDWGYVNVNVGLNRASPGILPILVLLVAFMTLSAADSNAAGPSPTFGVDGRVNLPGISDRGFSDIAVDQDGEIVVASSIDRYAKLTPDGMPDVAFGEEGVVDGAVPYFFWEGNPRPNAIGFQSDGKLVIAGRYGHRPFIVRMDPSGALDPTFARQGLRMDRNSLWNHPRTSYEDVAIDSKDRIIVAGFLGAQRTLIARYLANGRIDRSFGNRGRVTFRLHNPADSPSIGGLLALPGNRIFAIEMRTHSVQVHWLSARRGKVLKPKIRFPARFPLGARATLLADGSVVGGFSGDIPKGSTTRRTGPILFRVRPDGSLDRKFGGNGSVRFTSTRLRRVFGTVGRTSWGVDGIGTSRNHGVIVSGSIYTPRSPNRAVKFRTLTFRVTRRGGIDRRFGTNGAFYSARVDSAEGKMPALGLADGSTVVSGGGTLGGTYPYEQYLYRFKVP